MGKRNLLKIIKLLTIRYPIKKKLNKMTEKDFLNESTAIDIWRRVAEIQFHIDMYIE